MADSAGIEPTQPFGLTGFRDQRLTTRPTVRDIGGERQSRTGSGFHLYGLANRCIAVLPALLVGLVGVEPTNNRF